MAERSEVIHALLRHLELPPGVAGEIDWITGVLRVNRSSPQWSRYFQNPSGDEALTRTLYHEAHHLVQISMLTYLHRFALQMHVAIASVIERHYGDMAALPDSLGEMEKSARGLVWHMNWRDEHGISVIDIVEGLTYFTTAQYEHRRGCDEFLGHLAEAAIPDAYRCAFLEFVRRTASVASRESFFPIVCHLALCSWEPRKTFYALCESMADGTIDGDSTLDDFIAVSKLADPGYPGLATEFRAKLQTELPIRLEVYDGVQAAVSDDAHRTEFMKYLFSPHSHGQDLIPIVLAKTPVLLNPYADDEAAGFREWPLDRRGIVWDFGRFTLEQRPYWFLYLAATGRRYIGHLGRPPETGAMVAVRS